MTMTNNNLPTDGPKLPVTSLFCSFCGHHSSHHSEFKDPKLTFKCHASFTESCECTKYCEHFAPMEQDGFTCNNCYENFFDHDSVKRTVSSRLLRSDRYPTVPIPGEIAYRVYPVGLRQCCHWTLYQFMRRVENPAAELLVGTQLFCLVCKKNGVMELVNMKNKVYNWAWKFAAGTIESMGHTD